MKSRTGKKVVISFAADPAVKAELSKLKKHTTYVSALVTASLGICPLCFNRWPAKPEDTPDEKE